MELDPIAVALKFGFLAVLYLFLLWMARSALKDLRREGGAEAGYARPDYEDATGMHVASSGLGGEGDQGAPRLRVETAAGLRDGVAYDLSEGAVLGRSRDADVQVDDPNVSRKHAEVRPSGASWTVRDLGSTTGVKVNGRRIQGAHSLKDGDTITLGTSEIVFQLERS